MKRFLIAFLLVSFVGALPVAAQQLSVRPGINKPYENPDVERSVKNLERESREIVRQRAEIVALCELKPGMNVADVGAGTGLFTRLFAPQVQPEGKVYAVDISDEFVEHIEKTCREQGIKNVVGIVCSDTSTKLPPSSIDLVFVCDTYHHFEYPQKVLASIYQALRLGGRLVIIDYKKEQGVSADWVLKHVRADKKKTINEITAVGFKLIDEPELMKEQYVLRFEKVTPSEKNVDNPKKE